MSVINYSFDEDEYLFDNILYPKLNEILATIKSANPQFNYSNTLKVLISTSAEPNASCYGNSVLVFNVGMLTRMQNEDQIAFIVAHELAHQLLDHVDSKVKRTIAYTNSEEFKEQVKEMKKLEYGRNAALNNFLFKYTVNSRSKNRKIESQADSLGMILIKNTSYSLEEGLKLLMLLDEIDVEKYKDSIDFVTEFSNNDYTFNTALIKKRGGLEVKQELSQEILDSLKTHPDSEDRLNYMITTFDLERPELLNEVVQPSYLHHIDFETIRTDLLNQRYGRALKNSMLFKKYYNEDDFFHTISAICLGEIYLAQKNHTLRQFVPKPSDYYFFNYHRMLLMIENIRLSELRELYDNYYSAKVKLKEEDEHSLYLSYLHAKINGDSKAEEIKSDYIKNFPLGVYNKSLTKSTK